MCIYFVFYTLTLDKLPKLFYHNVIFNKIVITFTSQNCTENFPLNVSLSSLFTTNTKITD